MNKHIKYQFEQHPKTKGTCPSCGKYGKFRYLEDVNTGERLPMEFGRCERINSCGYANYPSKGLNTYSDGSYGVGKEKQPVQKYVDYLHAEQSLKAYQSNNLTQFLIQKFGKEQAVQAINKYHIGTGKNNSTIFWLVNEELDICNGKQMLYLPSGKRNKSIHPRYLFHASKGYKTCLFGLHLLAGSSEKDVIAIVESEKTAIIGSIFRPDLIWMASGGANGLTTEKILSLKERNIILIPDSDKAGRSGFKKQIENLQILKCQVKVLDLDSYNESSNDIADYILFNF